MINLSKNFVSEGGNVLYDKDFILNDKDVLMKELTSVGEKSFHRGASDNRVRGGFSLTGKEALVSERGAIPVPSVVWNSVVDGIADRITTLLVENEIMEPGYKINYCLYNMYESGKDTIAFHSDSENNSLSIIASLSLGYPRKFLMLEKATNDITEMTLGDGSLLVIAGDINSKYMHCVPPASLEKGVKPKRLNMTFRVITEPKASVAKSITNRSCVHKINVDGMKRLFFCDEFWFITPEEASNQRCIMFKNWGRTGHITTDGDLIKERLSKIRDTKNASSLADWFIIENKISYDELLVKLEKVSRFMRWRYPQIRNKRPNQVKIHTFREIYENTPEIGPESKYVKLF